MSMCVCACVCVCGWVKGSVGTGEEAGCSKFGERNGQCVTQQTGVLVMMLDTKPF